MSKILTRLFIGYLWMKLSINLLLGLKRAVFSDVHDDQVDYLNICLVIMYQLRNMPDVTFSPSDIMDLFRKMFKRYWAVLSRDKNRPNRGGRPKLCQDLIDLIHRIQSENPGFSPAKIREKMLQLNILDVPVRNTIRKYMNLHPDPPPVNRHGNRDQFFETFFKNHCDAWAADFFVIPTIQFHLLYVLIIINHSTREIVYFAVTYEPNAQWLTQQFREATPYGKKPKYLIHDNDPVFCSGLFKGFLKSAGIKSVKTSYRSPWQNGICERAIGTIKHELVYYIIPMSLEHFYGHLKEYIHYYNHHRTHQSLDGNTPVPSVTYLPTAAGESKLIGTPVLNSLYHTYRKVA